MTNACDITEDTCEIICPPSFLPPEMFGERSSNGREVAVTGQPSAVCQPLLLCSAASANAHIVELIPGLDAVEHETTADLQSIAQDALDIVITQASRDRDRLDRALARKAVPAARRHLRRRFRLDTYMWIARIGGLCRGLHESASYELCRRRERSLPDGYTCTHDLYLQVEAEGIQYDELGTMMLMGNTMSWDIIRDSMATSLENYRRLSDANPNPNPNPNQHLGEKTFWRCGHVYARPYSPGHARPRGCKSPPDIYNGCSIRLKMCNYVHV